MNLLYVVPALGPCGGIRIVVEHCNRLKERHPDWRILIAAFKPDKPNWINVDVPIINFNHHPAYAPYDAVVATGYQTVKRVNIIRKAKRKVYFVQMMEHLFFKGLDQRRHNDARESYRLAKKWGFEFITIAPWLKDRLTEFGADSIIVPNGVNMSEFHPRRDPKEHAIVIEGDGRNYAKDTEQITLKVALELREAYGYKIWGYAALHKPWHDRYDTFIHKPTTAQMRKLYSNAKFMLKASRYEGRACAPVEAMCCGTPSVRGIIEGDPDIIDGYNALRVGYDYQELHDAAFKLASNLATGGTLYEKLQKGCKEYAQTKLRWEPMITKLARYYE